MELTEVIVVGRTVQNAERAGVQSHGPIIVAESIIEGHGVKQGQQIELCMFADHVDFGKPGTRLLLFLSGDDNKVGAWVAAWGPWGEMVGLPVGHFKARLDAGEQTITVEDVKKAR